MSRKVDIVSTFDTAGIKVGADKAVYEFQKIEQEASKAAAKTGRDWQFAADEASKAATKTSRGWGFAADEASKAADKAIYRFKKANDAAKKGGPTKAEYQANRLLQKTQLEKAMEGKGAHWRDYIKAQQDYGARGKGAEFEEKFKQVKLANLDMDQQLVIKGIKTREREAAQAAKVETAKKAKQDEILAKREERTKVLQEKEDAIRQARKQRRDEILAKREEKRKAKEEREGAEGSQKSLAAARAAARSMNSMAKGGAGLAPGLLTLSKNLMGGGGAIVPGLMVALAGAKVASVVLPKALDLASNQLEDLSEHYAPDAYKAFVQLKRGIEDFFDYSSRVSLDRMHKEMVRAQEDFEHLDRYTIGDTGKWLATQREMFAKQYEYQKTEAGRTAYQEYQTGPSAEAFRGAYLAGPRATYMQREVDKTVGDRLGMQAADRQFHEEMIAKRKALEAETVEFNATTYAGPYGGVGTTTRVPKYSPEEIDRELSTYHTNLIQTWQDQVGLISKGGPEGEAAFKLLKSRVPENKQIQAMDKPEEMVKYLYETGKTEQRYQAEFQTGKHLKQTEKILAARQKILAQGGSLVDLELEAAIAAMHWEKNEEDVSEDKQKQLELDMRSLEQQNRYKGITEQQRHTGYQLQAQLDVQNRILNAGVELDTVEQRRIQIQAEFERKEKEINDMHMDEVSTIKALLRAQHERTKELEIQAALIKVIFNTETKQFAIHRQFAEDTKGQVGQRARFPEFFQRMEEIEQRAAKEHWDAAKRRQRQDEAKEDVLRARGRAIAEKTWMETRGPTEQMRMQMQELLRGVTKGGMDRNTAQRKLMLTALDRAEEMSGPSLQATNILSPEGGAIRVSQMNQTANIQGAMLEVMRQILWTIQGEVRAGRMTPREARMLQNQLMGGNVPGGARGPLDDGQM